MSNAIIYKWYNTNTFFYTVITHMDIWGASICLFVYYGKKFIFIMVKWEKRAVLYYKP